MGQFVFGLSVILIFYSCFSLSSLISHLFLAFSVPHSLSSLSPSSLSHFLRYYMALSVTHQRFASIIWTTIITKFSITIILIRNIAWPISPNIKVVNPSNILIEITHLLRKNNNRLRRKDLGIRTTHLLVVLTIFIFNSTKIHTNDDCSQMI